MSRVDPLLPLVVAAVSLGGLLGLGLYVRRQVRGLRRALASRPAPPPPPPVEPPAGSRLDELAERLDGIRDALASERARLDRVQALAEQEPDDPAPRLEAQLELVRGRLDEHEERLGKARGWATDVGGRLSSLAAEVEALAARVAASTVEESPERATEEAIRAYLRREGLREIRLLEDPDDPAVKRFEARRGGLLVKGRAGLDEQGYVTVRQAPSLRAFP